MVKHLRGWPIIVAGGAVLLSFLLPAMHRLGGGTFSTLEYLGEVQSSGKGMFLLGLLLGAAGLAAGLAPGRKGAGAGALAAGLAGMTLHLPAFGDMADTGRDIAWPWLVAILAAAALWQAGKQAGSGRRLRVALALALALASLALVLLSVLPQVDHAVPSELGAFARRRGIHRSSLLGVLVAALKARETGWWLALSYAAALLVTWGSSLCALCRSQADVVSRWLAAAAVGQVGPCWFLASALPGSPYAWDLLVRLRVAILSLAFVTLVMGGTSWLWAPPAASRR